MLFSWFNDHVLFMSGTKFKRCTIGPGCTASVPGCGVLADDTKGRWILVGPFFPVILFLALFTSCNEKPAQPRSTISPEQLPAITAAAEKGIADAQRILGEAYAKGAGVKQDYGLAAKWYQMAAAQGDARAQVALGELYEAGQGVQRDEKKAADCYRRAAEQGLASAQYNLATLYAVGKGVPLDNNQALNWYTRAANQGDSLAQYNVGMRYFESHGVASDPILAYKWLSLAADRGLPDAERALKLLKTRMSSDQIAHARELARTFKPQSTGKPAD
jgi:hypothetical protein